MIKVFLSSIFLGLGDYRAKVRAAIDNLDGYKCIAMEDFGASDTSTEKLCRDKVAECAIFVGIIGPERGSKPPGSQLSYCEIEYHEAMKLVLPCHIYIMAKGVAYRADLRNSDADQRAHDRFRRVLRDAHTPYNIAESDSADALATQVISDLHNAASSPAPPAPIGRWDPPRQRSTIGLAEVSVDETRIGNEPETEQLIVAASFGVEQHRVGNMDGRPVHASFGLAAATISVDLSGYSIAAGSRLGGGARPSDTLSVNGGVWHVLGPRDPQNRLVGNPIGDHHLAVLRHADPENGGIGAAITCTALDIAVQFDAPGDHDNAARWRTIEAFLKRANVPEKHGRLVLATSRRALKLTK